MSRTKEEIIKKKTEDQTSSRRYLLSVVIVAFAILFAGVIAYLARYAALTRDVSFNLMEKKIADIKKQTEAVGEQYVEKVNDVAFLIGKNGLADRYFAYYADNDELKASAAAQDIALLYGDDDSVVCLLNKDKKGYDSLGNNRDLSERFYLDSVFNGRTVFNDAFAAATNERGTLIAAPIKRNDDIIGVFGVFYPLKAWEEKTFGKLDATDCAGALVLDANYRVILNRGDEVFADLNYGDDFFNYLSGDAYRRKYKLLREEVSATDYSRRYETKDLANNEKIYYSFARFNCGDETNYLIVADRETKLVENAAVLRSSRWILIVAVVVFFLASAFVAYYGSRLQKKDAERYAYRYKELLKNIDGGVIIATFYKNGAQNKLLYANEGFARLTGYDFEDFRKPREAMTTIVYRDDAELFKDIHKRKLEDFNDETFVYRLVKKTGEIVYVKDKSIVLRDDDYPNAVMSILTAAGDEKEREEQAALVDETYSSALKTALATVVIIDYPSRRILKTINFSSLFGYELPDKYATIKEAIDDGIVCEDDFPLYLALKENVRLRRPRFYAELRLRNANGAYVTRGVHVSLTTDANKKLSRVVLVIEDAEAKIKMKTKRRKGETDVLTGLTAAPIFANAANKLLKEGKKKDAAAFLLIKINNLTRVSDLYGAHRFDEITQEIATRISHVVREDDLTARVGVDEFAMFLKTAPAITVAEDKARRVLFAIEETASAVPQANLNVVVAITSVCKAKSDYNALYAKARAALATANHGEEIVRFEENDKRLEKILKTAPSSADLAAKWILSANDVDAFKTLYSAINYKEALEKIANELIARYRVTTMSFVCFPNKTTTAAADFYDIHGLNPNIQETRNVKDFDFAGDELIVSDARILGEKAFAAAQKFNAAAVLRRKIKNAEGKVIGAIAFNDVKPRLWNEEERITLAFLARTLAPYFKAVAPRNLDEFQQWLVTSLPGAKYIVDDNYRVAYVSDEIKAAMPKFAVGASCYKAIRGKDAPCADCVLNKMGGEGVYYALLPGIARGVTVKITWEGNPATIFVAEETEFLTGVGQARSLEKKLAKAEKKKEVANGEKERKE